ncbi:MAG TPA: CoA transferase, partial [Acidimicrobiales bacterium]|nr:CoA transferase [Acidimicrobiales bacterium]
ARQIGFWSDDRGTNMLDTGAPFYDTYECADGKYVAVGAIEPQFYGELLDGLGLDPAALPDRDDHTQWDALRAVFAGVLRTRSRDEWAQVFATRDACVAPVLTLAEAPDHPHNVARSTFVEVDGVRHPAPAPRLDRTPGELAVKACYAGQHTDEVLRELGYDAHALAELRAGAVVA